MFRSYSFYLVLFSYFLFVRCTAQSLPTNHFDNQDRRVGHVIVALCDNQYQGIVPVSEKIGNGQDPFNNLYWGALYGVKTFFKKQSGWTLMQTEKHTNDVILERLVFRHKNKKDWLVADAYDGQFISDANNHFLKSLGGEIKDTLNIDNQTIGINGNAQLIAYVGHNYHMDYDINPFKFGSDGTTRDAIMLGCATAEYYRSLLKKVGASPILLTTNLMAPEAYTLDAAIDAYLQEKNLPAIHEAAAQAYHQYQKCGIKGARRLFTTQ